MNRRRWLGFCGACALCGLQRAAFAQSEWTMPPRFSRPAIDTDEGGLWAMMDREEGRLRRSPFLLQAPDLREYVHDIVCRLAGDHCPDVRVYLMRTPWFNASMAPNGMMQVWSGLLLRVENEAQLAAVLGHELGHYLARHSVDNLRDAKTRGAFGTFMAAFGVVGLVAQVAAMAGAFGYSREQENDADRIGAALMARAGWDPAEASKVWENLLLEISARPNGAAESVMFATHPNPVERQQRLIALARELGVGESGIERWREHTRAYRSMWLMDEIKRGQHEESIALFTRMLTAHAEQPDVAFARGEVRRLRAQEGDLDAAVADFQAAIRSGAAPAEVYRSVGLIHYNRGETEIARGEFEQYLALAPTAPDAPMIKSYLEEMKS